MKEQDCCRTIKERKHFKRVGLELDDTQLSQVPKPEPVEEKPLPEPRKPKLGSFWTDEY
jgi:hypothetical protein